MYEAFYGFKEKPFNITPDPEYLYMSGTHEKAYTYFEYAITENKAFVVITGEIGSGKTTLINYLLHKIPQDIHVGIINNTRVLPLQLIKMICHEYELEVTGLDKIGMLDTLHRFLLKTFSERKRVVLIIDEAQNLPSPSIEEIRLLSNLEADKHHLIQIILVGQPNLKYKLQRKALEQFRQRVTVSTHLEGLKKEEVGGYIRHRLQVAGASNLDIFNIEAIEAIYQHSKGIPRLINILCDAALVHGYADDIKIIDRKIVDEAASMREGEGIFKAPEGDREEAEPSFHLERRFQSLEEKVHLLENIIRNMDQKLERWLTKKGQHESHALELLKLLKRSLESRRDLILKYYRLKKQLESDKEQASLSPPQDHQIQEAFEEVKKQPDFFIPTNNHLKKQVERDKAQVPEEDLLKKINKIKLFH